MADCLIRDRRSFLAASCVLAWGAAAGSRGEQVQPAAATVASNPAPTPAHPLDPAIQVALEEREFLRTQVRDYTATIIKRERIQGQLGEYQYMFAKIRHAQKQPNGVQIPFSVYLKFLKPKSVEGREVIWVEGRNGGNIVAHETGLLNIKRVSVAPDGFLAMVGQRYPITKIGVQNLIEELLVRGDRDRRHGECDVQFFQNATINKRACRMIQVVHPVPRPYFDFHKAQIFIDQETKMPVRYAAWTWPTSPGGEPVLEEEYTYVDIKINVGLTDRDFDPDNSQYNYPRL